MVHMDVVAQWEMQQDFFHKDVFRDKGFYRCMRFQDKAVYLLETNHRTVWDLSRINHQCVFLFRVERRCECSFELRQCPDLSVDSVVQEQETKSTSCAI